MTKADVEVLDALASDPDVLHADGDPTASFLDDLAGLETPPALGANGTHELLLDPPASADFLLYVAAPTGTSVTLDVDGVTAIPTTPTDADGELRSVDARSPSPRATSCRSPSRSRACPRVRRRSCAGAPTRWPRPRSRRRRVYDAGAYEQAERTLRRVQKAVLAAKALGLTAGEVADLGAVRTATAGLWNGLAVDGTIAAADVEAQWARLAWVLWFVAAEEGARAGGRHVPRHPARPGRGRRAGHARGGRRHGVGRGGPHRGAHGVRSRGERSRRPRRTCAG